MRIVTERDGMAIFEIIDGAALFYPVTLDRKRNQVYSLAPTDQPRGSGRWMAHATAEGVKYVARGRTLAAARAVIRREIASRAKMGA